MRSKGFAGPSIAFRFTAPCWLDSVTWRLFQRLLQGRHTLVLGSTFATGSAHLRRFVKSVEVVAGRLPG